MSDVTLDAVKKIYPGGVEAVKSVSFAIPDGSLTVLVGPSGCGKSTLLRMVAGLETVSGGTISIGPRIVNDIEPADRDIAMVFQNYALYPHMSVYDNMAYGLRNRRVPEADIRLRVDKAARMLALDGYLDRRPRALSGGQRQRVAMGRAIVRDPQVFLFDEPLSNLDAKLRVQMRVEIARLQASLGVTSIYVTHDQLEAMTLADQLVVMNDGRIEQIGKPIEVYRHPRSVFVAGFLGSPPMNFLDAALIEPGLVRLQGGAALKVDPARHNGKTGQAVTLGARPETLAIGPSDGQGLPCTVDLVEELGAASLVYASHAGQDLVIVTEADDAPPRGSAVTVVLATDQTHLFDPKTGTSLMLD